MNHCHPNHRAFEQPPLTVRARPTGAPAWPRHWRAGRGVTRRDESGRAARVGRVHRHHRRRSRRIDSPLPSATATTATARAVVHGPQAHRGVGTRHGQQGAAVAAGRSRLLPRNAAGSDESVRWTAFDQRGAAQFPIGRCCCCCCHGELISWYLYKYSQYSTVGASLYVLVIVVLRVWSYGFQKRFCNGLIYLRRYGTEWKMRMVGRRKGRDGCLSNPPFLLY